MIKDALHSFLINTASKIFLANRTILKGKWQWEKTICISFDCDYESDMLRLKYLLPLLKKNAICTSFVIPGRLVKKFSATVEILIENGHEIVNHTLTHPNSFRNLSTLEKGKEIQEFQKLMENLFGYSPQGFRCPHLLHQYREELMNVLKENNIKYDSSLLGNCVFLFDNIIEIPLTPCPHHPYRAFDSYHHFYPSIVSESLESFLRGFKQIIEENDLVNIFLDPRDLIDRIPLKTFEEMIYLAKEKDFTFSPLNDICLKTKMRVSYD